MWDDRQQEFAFMRPLLPSFTRLLDRNFCDLQDFSKCQKSSGNFFLFLLEFRCLLLEENDSRAALLAVLHLRTCMFQACGVSVHCSTVVLCYGAKSAFVCCLFCLHASFGNVF